MREGVARNRWIPPGLTAAVLAATVALATAASGGPASAAGGPPTATPITHLVVIFQENVSFDHYFGTYPNAANTPADPVTFTPRPGTPTVDGLTPRLLRHNPNKANPRRLGPAQAVTCDQDHEYRDEQLAFDGGRMDRFVEHTGVTDCTAPQYGAPDLVMDYYDGNTVTAMWNYAQRYAMSDAFFGTTFGPSTVGAINLVSGQTHGGYAVDPSGRKVTDPAVVSSADPVTGIGTLTADPDPAFDDCSGTGDHAAMTGRNIGDLLNGRHVSWGWFQGGFRPTAAAAGTGRAVCGASHTNVAGASSADYNPHHEPFQYYRSTANPHHLPPSSASEIGHDGQANHQYDLADFDTALGNGSLPAVSFLKAADYQDGHAGYSDPIDEQHFLAGTLNRLQRSKEWASTAVVITYDDSDGWYDHRFAAPVNSSHDPSQDALDGPGRCGASGAAWGGYADRCGHGPRLPLLVLSPYARPDHVDHTLTDQTSVLRFIEDNWHTGRIGDSSYDAHAGTLQGMFDFAHPHEAPLLLDPATGLPVTGGGTAPAVGSARDSSPTAVTGLPPLAAGAAAGPRRTSRRA